MWFFAGQDKIWFFLMLFGAFREKNKNKKTSIYLPQVAITKRNWSKKHFFFLSKGFLIFVLHCVRNSQVSLKLEVLKLECTLNVVLFLTFHVYRCLYLFTLLVYLQIRERFKRKVNTVFPSTNNGNSTKKSSQVNPSGVGDTWVAELQSFDEFELEKHSAWRARFNTDQA